MSILIGASEFLGPINDLDLLESAPGIYAVLCLVDDEYELLDLYDADNVRSAVQSHPERSNWLGNGLELSIAVHYTQKLSTNERESLRAEIEREFDCDLELAA